MKKNIKLFFSSLVNNNSVIDGARKKPWYAAIVIFFISLVLSVVPGTVMELKKQGDKYFESNTYMLREAVTDFSRELQNPKYNSKMLVYEEGNNKYLSADASVFYENYYGDGNSVHYVFQYIETNDLNGLTDYVNDYKAKNLSFVLFTKDYVYISIVDPNTPDGANPKVILSCLNAYKKLEQNAFRSAYVSPIEAGNQTESINKTWENWKVLIKNLYNQTRVRTSLVQLGLISAINAVITLIMGFMIWVLTRGKNNPYRLFTVWESFKIAFWASVSPAILTITLGFLIQTFAATMFPLLIGVRVMWLSMKSLRPDGSGYAAD